MKHLLLLFVAIAATLGLGACNTGENPTPAPINPPGSGGRGNSPGMHAQEQAPR